MSHHTHVFLTNEETAEGAMSFVNSYLDNEMCYSNGVDRYNIIGVLNLTTGEFTKNKYCFVEYINEPTTIAKLEEYANSLFSKEQYEQLEKDLKRHLLNKHFWNAARVCEQLDGIVYAVHDNRKWTAKDPFPINDGYLQHAGITDLQEMYHPIKDCTVYAVIVEFHK